MMGEKHMHSEVSLYRKKGEADPFYLFEHHNVNLEEFEKVIGVPFAIGQLAYMYGKPMSKEELKEKTQMTADVAKSSIEHLKESIEYEKNRAKKYEEYVEKVDSLLD